MLVEPKVPQTHTHSTLPMIVRRTNGCLNGAYVKLCSSPLQKAASLQYRYFTLSVQATAGLEHPGIEQHAP